MIALFLVLVASLIVAGAFLSGFIWSVKNDQFEDKEGSALRMLFDDHDNLVHKTEPLEASKKAVLPPI